MCSKLASYSHRNVSAGSAAVRRETSEVKAAHQPVQGSRQQLLHPEGMHTLILKADTPGCYATTETTQDSTWNSGDKDSGRYHKSWFATGRYRWSTSDDQGHGRTLSS